MTKTCTKCGITKPDTRHHFYYYPGAAKTVTVCIACYRTRAAERAKARYFRLKNDPVERAKRKLQREKWEKRKLEENPKYRAQVMQKLRDRLLKAKRRREQNGDEGGSQEAT